jgi:hypothetical protein
MAVVNLEDQEWNFVLGILADKCSWRESNSIIMKIGSQLRMQQDAKEQKQREQQYPQTASRGISTPTGNSYRSKSGEEIGPEEGAA